MSARIRVDLHRVIGRVDPKIYGQFMCRRPGVTDGGIYDAGNPLSDEWGFRRDVFDAVRRLRPTVIRWPGGCTGTSYHWVDGVGPREGRPRKIDLHFGWASDYGFGTDEFVEYCRRLGAEPLLVTAMGTGTLEEAASWLEYCNLRPGTYYANLRERYGHPEPFRVGYWQLGNEQLFNRAEIGYTTAEDYAQTAREWAKTLRRLDPSIRILSAAGVDLLDCYRRFLPELAHLIDYVALHCYWRAEPETGGEGPYYQMVSGPNYTEGVIRGLAALIEGVRREVPHSRDIGVAVTEWNAWCGSPMAYPGGPQPPVFHLREALAVAAFLNVMQRRCRAVRLATMAQTVNVLGLLLVRPEAVLREPIYWPVVMQVEHSGETALDAWVECDTFDEPQRRMKGVPYLDVASTWDEKRGRLFLSVVNRHLREDIETSVEIEGARVSSRGEAHLLRHDDPMAMNTFEEPDEVKPRSAGASGLSDRFTWTFPAHSYTILELNATAEE